MHRINKAGQKL